MLVMRELHLYADTRRGTAASPAMASEAGMPVPIAKAARAAEKVEFTGPVGWLPRTGTVVVFGAGGSGKSMVLMTVVHAVASPVSTHDIRPFGESLPDGFCPIAALWIEAEKKGNIAARAKDAGIDANGSAAQVTNCRAASPLLMLTLVVCSGA
jgi:AAA domain